MSCIKNEKLRKISRVGRASGILVSSPLKKRFGFFLIKPRTCALRLPLNSVAGPWIPAFAGMTENGLWHAHIHAANPRPVIPHLMRNPQLPECSPPKKRCRFFLIKPRTRALRLPSNSVAGPWIPAFAGMTENGFWHAHIHAEYPRPVIPHLMRNPQLPECSPPKKRCRFFLIKHGRVPGALSKPNT